MRAVLLLNALALALLEAREGQVVDVRDVIVARPECDFPDFKTVAPIRDTYRDDTPRSPRKRFKKSSKR